MDWLPAVERGRQAVSAWRTQHAKQPCNRPAGAASRRGGHTVLLQRHSMLCMRSVRCDAIDGAASSMPARKAPGCARKPPGNCGVEHAIMAALRWGVCRWWWEGGGAGRHHVGDGSSVEACVTCIQEGRGAQSGRHCLTGQSLR
mmetsp:Transcript_34020/g.86131  ORF Transcript_34020/g.86131 Transcript_34020/m.86131 type:complete len:144 (+) Transcript_34020:690-1121(+)